MQSFLLLCPSQETFFKMTNRGWRCSSCTGGPGFCLQSFKKSHLCLKAKFLTVKMKILIRKRKGLAQGCMQYQLCSFPCIARCGEAGNPRWLGNTGLLRLQDQRAETRVNDQPPRPRTRLIPVQREMFFSPSFCALARRPGVRTGERVETCVGG